MTPASDRFDLLYLSSHAPQPKTVDEPDAHELLLRDLAERYRHVKLRGSVIWRTREGVDLLNRLRKAHKAGATRTALANALDVTPQGLDKMLKRTPTRQKLRKWPEPEDLQELQAAWSNWQPKIGRREPAFIAIHRALQALLDRGFEDYEIAAALSQTSLGTVPVRHLRRFRKQETDAETRARAIKKLVDRS